MVNSITCKKEKGKKITDLAKIAAYKPSRLVKIARLLSLNQTLKREKSGKRPFKKILPKIVGDLRHYPPANKEWKNSVYAYNKDSLRSIAAQDKIATRTIKSYFNLTDNRKLARSYRMRNLIRRTTSKRIYASKPDIKQTSNKVNITVYVLNREGQFLLRKLYFYKKNMNINRDIYLHKIWLKKNLLAFKKTFKDKKSIRLLGKNRKLMTKRQNRNKTYIHNILIKRYLSNQSSFERLNKSIPFSNDMESKSLINNSSLTDTTKSSTDIRRLELRSIIKLKCFKRRNSIRFIKERAKLGLSHSFDQFKLSKKAFTNYLLEKKSRKIKFKLRNANSTIKIKKRLSRFFFLKGKRKKIRFKKIRLPYSNLRFKKEIKFFSFKLVSELKYIRKLFLFRFIKYIFSLLQIKIYLSNNMELASSALNSKEQGQEKNYNSLKYEFTGRVKRSGLQTLTDKTNRTSLIRSFKNRYSYSKLKKIELLNLELLNFLKYITSKAGKKVLSLNNVLNQRDLGSLYKKFEKKYFLSFLAKYFKKEFLYINYFSKFLINKFKFGKFLPGLKYLIQKIYSKKVKLNIVNLKYPHLNSDIYADSIASKLRKKLGLLRVLRSSLSLAKLPSEYLSYDRLAASNKLSSLTIHKSLHVNKDLGSLNNKVIRSKSSKQDLTKDPLNQILNKLYPDSFVTFAQRPAKNSSLASNNSLLTSSRLSTSATRDANQTSNIALSKNLKILNTIRYKWVSGVRLEAAGRLTRRYKAARSVFKFRYKGSLKNIDYSQKADKSKRNASTVMLRNYVKSNSQYSFSKSKRRIGAFGLKAWLASY